MSSVDGNQSPFVYKDEATMHGIKELVASPIRWHRLLWFGIMIMASIAMLFQLKGVTDVFAEDRIGTNIVPYNASELELPKIMFCPRFNYFKPESGITQEMYDFINGYHYQSPAYHRMTNPNAPKPSVVAAEAVRSRIRASPNGSYEKLLRDNALAFDRIVSKVKPFPVTFAKGQTKSHLVTTAGFCYVVGVLGELTESLAEYVGFIVTLNDTYNMNTAVDGEEYYYGYIGDMGSLAVQPSLAGRLPIPKQRASFVKLRITKRIRYPGRRKNLCKNYDRSDQKWCLSEAIDKHMCDSCQHGTFPSTSNQESIEDPDVLCNLYDRMPCMLLMAGDRKKVKRLRELCPDPCVSYVYDRVVGVSHSEKPEITVMMDNLALTRVVEEYALITPSDFLASLGGTLGLYCGASLLSVFQLLFYLFGAPCRCGDRKRKRTCRKCRSDKVYKWA